MKSTSLVVLFLVVAKICQSQVLIALLFGDKLNSDKLEFGITLGNSFSTQTNFAGDWRLKGWNVGLWFNVKLSDRFYFHPGAIPKSTLGFRNLPEYNTGIANIQTAIDSFNFEVERKVNYIHVPLLIRYRAFTIENKAGKKQSLFFELGPQISLRTGAKDIFRDELDDDNTILYENDLRDEIRRFDVSVSAGVVWKFRKLLELSVSYNQGFLDIDKEDATGKNLNQFIMVNVNIPIGAGKKKDPAAAGAEGTEKAKEPKAKKQKKTKGTTP